MTIKTETRTVNIALQKWVSGWNAGYEPDCFEDLEVNFPMNHPKRVDGDWIIIASDAEVNGLIDWWKSECDTVNSGEEGECLYLSEEDIGNGCEWVLLVDGE